LCADNQETLTNFTFDQGYGKKRNAANDYTFALAMANADVSVTCAFFRQH
jgi:hypothetical protein